MSSLYSPTLPTETIDSILDFLCLSFSTSPTPPLPVNLPARGKKQKEKQPVNSNMTWRDSLKVASLVTKGWRAPSQKRLFEKVLVKGAKGAQRATQGASESPFLAAFTKSIRIDCGVKKGRKPPTAAEIKKHNILADVQLVPLLNHFPNVIELELYKPSFTTFRYFDPLQLTFLSRLTKLVVHSTDFDPSSTLLHSLLPFTPNLVDLRIITADNSVSGKAFSESTAPDLTHLRFLRLFGTDLREDELLGLLSKSTFERLTHAEVHGLHGKAVFTLTKYAGPSLTFLRCRPGYYWTLSEILRPCTNLKELEIFGDHSHRSIGMLTGLPHSVYQVTFVDGSPAWILEELKDLDESGGNLSQLTTFALCAQPMLKELEEMEVLCERLGIANFVHPPPIVVSKFFRVALHLKADWH